MRKLKNLGLSLLTAGIFASGSMPANAQDLEERVSIDTLPKYGGNYIREIHDFYNKKDQKVKSIDIHKLPSGHTSKCFTRYYWDDNNNMIIKKNKWDDEIDGSFDSRSEFYYSYDENGKQISALIKADTDYDGTYDEIHEWDLEKDGIPKKEKKGPKDTIGEAHALIYTSQIPDIENKNINFHESVKVYNSLLDFGVKKKNIYFLCNDTLPMSNDEDVKKISKNLRSNKENISPSTLNNLCDFRIKLGTDLSKKDTLMVFFNTLGLNDFICSSKLTGYAYSSKDEFYIEPTMMELIAKDDFQLLFVTNQDYSKLYIDQIFSDKSSEKLKKLKAECYAGSPNGKSIKNKKLGFGSKYFSALNNKENDFNKDGKVDFGEAYEATKKIYNAIGKSLKIRHPNKFRGYDFSTYSKVKK